MANTPYRVGSVLTPVPINGQAYRCTSAGTSGADRPSGQTSAGNTVTDGTVTWTDIGQSFVGVPLPSSYSDVNGLTEMLQNGSDSNGNPIYRFRFRPLTPHPSANPAVTGGNVFQHGDHSLPVGLAQHHDSTSQLDFRSLSNWVHLGGTPPRRPTGSTRNGSPATIGSAMARDIYTLLYLTGGGADTPSTHAYTIRQLRGDISNALELVTGIRPLHG